GEAACAAVFRADEGRGAPTILADRVLQALSMPNLQTFTYAIIDRTLPQAQISRLAPLVFEAADTGDAVAQSIILRLADEIVTAALALLRRLDLSNLDTDVVLGGSVMHGRGPLLIDNVTERIAAECPKAHVRRLTLPP